MTQSFRKNGVLVHEAIDRWHPIIREPFFCLVQFKETAPHEMPRVYAASPEEMAERMKASAGGRSDTILYEEHVWGSGAAGFGTTDYLPEEWTLSSGRLQAMFENHEK